MTFRQWRFIVRRILLSVWVVPLGLACISAPLIAQALSNNTAQALGLSVNIWVPATGLLLLFLVVPLNNHYMQTHISYLPLSSAGIARTYWGINIVLISLLAAISPVLLPILGSDGAIWPFGWFPEASPRWGLLPMLFVSLAAFVATCSWRRHPRLARHSIWILLPACVAWAVVPLDPMNWNMLHVVVAVAALIIAALSYLQAPKLFSRPARDLLRRDDTQDRLPTIQEFAATEHAPFQKMFPQLWRHIYFVGALILILGVLRWSTGLSPLDASLSYAVFIIPIAEAWPHDLSVTRTLPVRTFNHVARVVRKYLGLCALSAAFVVCWHVGLEGRWTAEQSLVVLAIVGYGFMVRLILWVLIPEKNVMDTLLWLIVILGCMDAAGVGSEGISQLPLAHLLGFTAPIVLMFGVWILHLSFRDYMSVCQVRHAFSTLFQWSGSRGTTGSRHV
jgi:hypothetical protein